MILLAVAVTGLVAGALAGWLIARHIGRKHPPQGEFLDVDGTRLHFRRSGGAGRSAILVLHGAASNLEEPHLALSETLSHEAVIWLDRPGLGWSGRPATRPWSPGEEAALIARFLEQMKIDEVIVIGHSWGGAIAMRLAIDHPGRVTGLILIAPALSAWIGKAAWFNPVSGWPVLGPLLTRIFIPLIGHASLRSGAKSAFHPEAVPEDYVRRTHLPLILRPQNWIANARDMSDVNTHLEHQETRYEAVSAPAIFLAGKADTVLWTHRHSGQVAARMPEGELRLIRGAGHNLHHHHPEAVLDAVRTVRERAAALTNPVQNAG